MLHRAIYVSDAIGDSATSMPALVQILGVGHANNRRDQLTSVLLHHEGQFLQAIEGLRSDIDRLLRRLQADPRHSNLRVLMNGPVAVRSYGDAPMRRLSMNAGTCGLLAGAALSDLDVHGAEALLAAAATHAAAA